MNISLDNHAGCLRHTKEMDDGVRSAFEEDQSNDKEHEALSRLIDLMVDVDLEPTLRITRALLDPEEPLAR
jgi:hypothetical protein